MNKFTGFVALSDIVQGCYECGWPKPEWITEIFRCVREDFVEECRVNNSPIWTNEDSLAYSDGSFWKIEPVNGLSTFFMSNNDNSAPPNGGKAWCLIKA